jgi:hypothetical protein
MDYKDGSIQLISRSHRGDPAIHKRMMGLGTIISVTTKTSLGLLENPQEKSRK